MRCALRHALGTEFGERVYSEPQLVHKVPLPSPLAHAASAAPAASCPNSALTPICRKGEEVATFDFGSTVVLIFETPAGFTWNVDEGKHVSLGETIGAVGRTGASDQKSLFFVRRPPVLSPSRHRRARIITDSPIEGRSSTLERSQTS